jgi:hypothetical protein
MTRLTSCGKTESLWTIDQEISLHFSWRDEGSIGAPFDAVEPGCCRRRKMVGFPGSDAAIQDSERCACNSEVACSAGRP